MLTNTQKTKAKQIFFPMIRNMGARFNITELHMNLLYNIDDAISNQIIDPEEYIEEYVFRLCYTYYCNLFNIDPKRQKEQFDLVSNTYKKTTLNRKGKVNLVSKFFKKTLSSADSIKDLTEKFILISELLKEKLQNNTLRNFLKTFSEHGHRTNSHSNKKKDKLFQLLSNLGDLEFGLFNKKWYITSNLSLLKKTRLKNSFAEDSKQEPLFRVLLNLKGESTSEVFVPAANLKKITIYKNIFDIGTIETITNTLEIDIAEIFNNEDINLTTTLNLFKTFFEFIATGKLRKDINAENFIELLTLLNGRLFDYFIIDNNPEIQDEITNNLTLQFLQNNDEQSIELDLFKEIRCIDPKTKFNCKLFLQYYSKLIEHLEENFKILSIQNPNNPLEEYNTNLASDAHYLGLSYLNHIGLNYVEVPGDGNCFYSAVLAGLNYLEVPENITSNNEYLDDSDNECLDKKKEPHSVYCNNYGFNNTDKTKRTTRLKNREKNCQIRIWKEQIVAYLHAHSEQYYHQIIATALSNQPDATPEEITPELFSQYLEQFCDNIMHDWADDFSISILMIILNRPIYIISSNGTIINLSAIQGLDLSIQNQPPIFVHYNQLYLPGQPGHYNALIPANSNPTNLQEIIEALTFNTNQAIQDHSVAAPGTTSSLLFTPLMSQQAPMTLDDITTTTTAPSIAFSATAPSSKKRKRSNSDGKIQNNEPSPASSGYFPIVNTINPSTALIATPPRKPSKKRKRKK